MCQNLPGILIGPVHIRLGVQVHILGYIQIPNVDSRTQCAKHHLLRSCPLEAGFMEQEYFMQQLLW